MFIHFGLYSTLGGVWKGQPYSGNYSEQIQSDAHIPQAEYAALAAGFQPSKWDPDAVVELARQAGMRFIVLTSKHHDGFSLFHTGMSRYNVVDASPYQRDIVKSLADACARANMPFGVYYSTIDWNYGDIPDPRNDNPISDAHADFNVAQIRELLTGYGPISEIWFDMGHPHRRPEPAIRPDGARAAAGMSHQRPRLERTGRFHGDGRPRHPRVHSRRAVGIAGVDLSRNLGLPVLAQAYGPRRQGAGARPAAGQGGQPGRQLHPQHRTPRRRIGGGVRGRRAEGHRAPG